MFLRAVCVALQVMLGLYIVRGDNMCGPALWTAVAPAAVHPGASHGTPPPCAPRSAVVGELDEAEDADIDWSTIVAEPLKPVVH